MKRLIAIVAIALSVTASAIVSANVAYAESEQGGVGSPQQFYEDSSRFAQQEFC